MMKNLFAAISLALLAACQSTPKLEEDSHHVRLATVVDRHDFSEVERKQAQAVRPRDSGFGGGFSIGGGTGGGFGGMVLGMGGMMGSRYDRRDEPPQVARGANRYTVQPLASMERIEVMSYEQYKVSDCVKVLAGHPTEYPRFFELKEGEHCE